MQPGRLLPRLGRYGENPCDLRNAKWADTNIDGLFAHVIRRLRAFRKSMRLPHSYNMPNWARSAHIFFFVTGGNVFFRMLSL